MLKELIQAWDEARNTAEKIQEVTEDGMLKQTFLLKFLGSEIEMHVAYKKKSESDEYDVDHPDISLYVRQTEKIIAFMSSSETPATEFIMCIINSLSKNAEEEQKFVEDRNKNQASLVRDRIMNVWRIRLEKTGDYTSNEIDGFIDYAISAYDSNPKLKNRADRFIDVITALSKDITSKEVAIQTHGRDIYIRDLIYNMICKCIGQKKENQFGDTYVSVSFMQKMFLNKVEGELPQYIQKTRDVMKNIFAKCDERPTCFVFAIDGLAQYYTLVTGESVEYRSAFLNNRHEQRRRFAANNDKTPYQPYVKKEEVIESVNYNTAFEHALANAKVLKK